ncbi:hypothetical protein QBC40DRAFT_320502 [Triangularia verruculosa]|uniref:Uncharacterized protein n=1 Tax=Triangularia verruculosa TaxID=2587418 RepID=A0AAN7AXZ7_9PEZI|nr:hypothetical protein QBC40DRAFT_320502 [Triangularia verruculosa]
MDTLRRLGTKKNRDSLPPATKSKALPKVPEKARHAARAALESLPAAAEARKVSPVDVSRPLPPLDPSSTLQSPVLSISNTVASEQAHTDEITLSEPWITSGSYLPLSNSTRNGSSPSPWEQAELNRLKASHDEEMRDLRRNLGMELEDTRRDMARRTQQLVEVTRLHERDREAINRVKELEEEAKKMKEELNNLKNNANQNFQIAENWKKAHDDSTKEKERHAEHLKESRQQIDVLDKQVARLEGEKKRLVAEMHTMEFQLQESMHKQEASFAKERQAQEDKADSKLKMLYQEMESMRDRLKRDHETEKMVWLEQMQVLKNELQDQAKKYEVHIRGLERDNTERLRALRHQQQLELDDARAKYQNEIRCRADEADAKFAAYTTMRDEQAARERQQFERQIADLNQVLMEKPGDFDLRLVSDRSLKEEYRALKRSVDTITFNLGPITVDRSIDTASFLEREGKGQERLFVKALIWAMIIDGFFSVPYGFGALGPGNNGGQLFELYRRWKKMLEGDGPKDEAGPLGQSEFEPFYREKYANSWRSATFQSILYATTAKDADGNTVVSSGIGKVVYDNCQRVQDNALAMLKSVCNNNVSQEIQEELATAMVRASELAIVFGAHRANVCFGIPKRGDSVELGREFVDCQDGHEKKGTTVTVELPVLPALFMIGDGKNDLTSVFCVEQGEVLPAVDR